LLTLDTRRPSPPLAIMGLPVMVPVL
jgi:hypothetical protein